MSLVPFHAFGFTVVAPPLDEKKTKAEESRAAKVDKLYRAAHRSSSSDGVPPQDKDDKDLYDQLVADGVSDPELLESVKKAIGKRWREKVKEPEPQGEDDPWDTVEDSCSPAREKPPPPPSNKMPAKKESQKEGQIEVVYRPQGLLEHEQGGCLVVSCVR